MPNWLHHWIHPQRSNNHRPALLHHWSIAIVSGLLVVASAVIAGLSTSTYLDGVLGFASTITAEEVIQETNQKRAESGLTPLRSNPVLAAAAVAKAQDMFNQQYWAHISPAGTEPWHFMQQSGYQYSVAGENLARDFSTTDQMIEAWMNSPTHRANIVHPRYEEIGIAVVDGNLLGRDTTLVVQMFGKPRTEYAFGQVPSEPTRTIAAQVDDQQTSDQVLAALELPTGATLQSHPLISPFNLVKLLMLAVTLVLASVLLYDSVVIGHKATFRIVSSNLGHIILLLATAYIVLILHSGTVL